MRESNRSVAGLDTRYYLQQTQTVIYLLRAKSNIYFLLCTKTSRYNIALKILYHHASYDLEIYILSEYTKCTRKCTRSPQDCRTVGRMTGGSSIYISGMCSSSAAASLSSSLRCLTTSCISSRGRTAPEPPSPSSIPSAPLK